MKAGFIGTGSMGEPLATNILNQEKSLVAYDINSEATVGLANKQARIVSSPADVANEAELVFACMPSIETFRAVITGADGVINGKQMKCTKNVRYQESMETVYSHSTITFNYEGRTYTVRFKK